MSLITVSGEYWADEYDDVIIADATNGDLVVILPDVASLAGKQYKVKKVDSSVNPVIVSGASSENFDGSLTDELPNQYDYSSYITDGSAWHIF
jgi:hypothetical protein